MILFYVYFLWSLSLSHYLSLFSQSINKSIFVKLNLLLVKKCFSYPACLSFTLLKNKSFVAVHLDVVNNLLHVTLVSLEG